MQVEALSIPEIKIFKPTKHGDARGFFSEVYNRKTLAAHGVDMEFVQDNHAMSARAGVLRGLHWQSPPFAQDKLVRVVKGSIFDVAVDLRRDAATYGRHVSATISAENWDQIFIPIGFAHGYVTLEPDTEVIYKVTNYYAPDHDAGMCWHDPALGIDWPIAPGDAVVSEKDQNLPKFSEIVSPF